MSADESETGSIAPRRAVPARPGRNEPCHCGSGKKYKKCHLERDEAEERTLHRREAALAAAGAEAAPKDENPAPAKPVRDEYNAPTRMKKISNKLRFQRKSGGG